MAAFAAAAFLMGSSDAFYVPGVHPLSFEKGEDVPLKVNALTSVHTQIPKDYYRLPFCKPENGPKMASENLGEFLTGNKIQDSPYVIQMLTEKRCSKLCQIRLNGVDALRLQKHIKYGYHNNWIIDNLPSANVAVSNGAMQKHYAGGFPIGFVDTNEKDAYIFNHVKIIIDYHVRDDGGYRVVGFGVEPTSVKHRFPGGFEWDGMASDGFHKELETCPTATTDFISQDSVETVQVVRAGEQILFTYDVTWIKSDVAWTSRWDVYLSEDHFVPPQVHWYSISNSILVVLFLSLVVLSVLVRNLRRDIAAYNSLAILTDEEEGDEEDEKGWKLVHADVFRPPQNRPMLYCVFMGTGVQLGLTTLFAIVFAAVGFLSPARRGSFMNANLAFYMLSGVCAGYVSSWLYKAFDGKYYQMCTVLTATLFPGISFAIFIFFNTVLAFHHSSASVPFLDVLIVAAMWGCISIPLTFVGAFVGYKKDKMEFPTITSSIARSIPEPPLTLNPWIGMTLTGIIPFAAAYVELFFIMTSLWMNQFYYVFGFTLIVYIILIITCAEVTLLCVYYQLCAENHRWWWYSFFCSGSVSFYMFGYSIIWFGSLEASKMPITYLLYFGYMFLISFGMLLVTGSVGALTSLWFVRTIFGTIKVD
ncbi:Transmembrane 9 superfamily [Seminavis robusta]|uniref:Transmembrane 9 superfamily member n=1 Tax=Seminavis robusta TaxID=568900 RepID=A0A9N8ECF5_9STRA|nr:Transmembrane 9 superfamily [Seminavis robusta]|eukprot:Sro752_g197160.1 Transmembrane 9 superfamily (645) ;mRNA; f:18422-20461